MKKILTLCIVCDKEKGKVLLGLKKRGFGVGRWNGFGGKVESDETIREAALRELREEAGIDTVDMHEVGVLDFSFENDPKILEVHIFRVDSFSGEPKESEEMKPEWFDISRIPFPQMWPDDMYWFPMLLRGKKFKGQFKFDRPSDNEYSAKIVGEELFEVSSL